MLICTDQMAEGDGFSLCRRATQTVANLPLAVDPCAAGAQAGLRCCRALRAMTPGEPGWAPAWSSLLACQSATPARTMATIPLP